MSVTKSGHKCQKWDRQTPHDHTFERDDMFANESVAQASNYCCNPMGADPTVWCYTMDVNKRWEFCDVPYCEIQLKTM